MRETRSQREELSEAFHLRLVHGNDLDICEVLSGPILLDNLSSVPLPTVLFLTNRYRDHLDCPRSGPGPCGPRTGPDPTGGSEGPGQRLLARPRVGRGQGQLLVDRPWGVGPGPDPDPTYFLCEINAVFLMSVALLSVVKKLKELSNISSYNSASGTNSNFAESKLRPNKKISN